MSVKLMGIYLISNLKNGKVYVGSAINIEGRWGDHKKNLRGNRHHSRSLQSSWNKHGEEWFRFSVLEDVQDSSFLIKREQYWMDFFKAYKKATGYNMCPTAGSRLGTVASEETKRRMSGSRKGVVTSEVHAEHLRTLRVGRKNSESHNEAISKANTGANRSTEHRRKISDTLMGRKHTTEVIERRAASLRGKKRSEESIERYKQAKSRIRFERASLTVDSILLLYQRANGGESTCNLAREFNVSPALASMIKTGKRWGDITQGGITNG